MPYKDPEKRKEYHRKYRETQKYKEYHNSPQYSEQRKKYDKKYRQSTKMTIVREKYNNSAKGKSTIKKYFKSTYGEAARKRASRNYIKSPKGKERRRIISLRLNYGLSVEDYNKLFDKQMGKCAICSKPPIHRKLDVDHNHATGKVRGLLCSTCNKVLGSVNDSVLLLKRAIQYLENVQ